MQNNLVVLKSPFSTVVKFMTYNVDQAVREEQVPDTKWMNRKDRVAALICDADADIVCLQEMRKLPQTITVNKWLSDFENYYYDVGYRNASMLSFGQATMYKPSKFYLDRTVKRWLSDTPKVMSDTWATKPGGTTGWGYLVLATRFLHVVDEKVVGNAPPLWVFNVHLGLEEELKTRSCKKLIEIVKDVTKGEKFIIAGDFNMFPDKDAHVQSAIMDEVFQDAGKGAVTLKGTLVEGTFVGFDHDAFKSDLKNMNSRLDRVYVPLGTKIAKGPVLYTKTMLKEEPEELTTRLYPSDHLPILLEIEVTDM